jgi:hypothetical protein
MAAKVDSNPAKKEKAQQYQTILTQQYAQSEYTKTINDPNFIKDAIYGKHLEDSLYANTYLAYQQRKFSTIQKNYEYAQKRYTSDA